MRLRDVVRAWLEPWGVNVQINAQLVIDGEARRMALILVENAGCHPVAILDDVAATVLADCGGRYVVFVVPRHNHRSYVSYSYDVYSISKTYGVIPAFATAAYLPFIDSPSDLEFGLAHHCIVSNDVDEIAGMENQQIVKYYIEKLATARDRWSLKKALAFLMPLAYAKLRGTGCWTLSHFEFIDSEDEVRDIVLAALGYSSDITVSRYTPDDWSYLDEIGYEFKTRRFATMQRLYRALSEHYKVRIWCDVIRVYGDDGSFYELYVDKNGRVIVDGRSVATPEDVLIALTTRFRPRRPAKVDW